MPRVNNKQFYSASIKEFGLSPQGVHWNSLATQTIRFKYLLKFLPKKLHRFTLLDVGCGFGDFYHYLLEHNRLPKQYIGVDSLDDMVNIATQQTGETIMHLDACKDELPQSDYIVCSGAMNVLTPFETHQFMHNCYTRCTKGFVFNVLFADQESQTYNYMTLNKIKRIANALNVHKITFNQGYLPHDITVGFYKKGV
jgi:SAM-dependent methyltransferase